MSRLFRKVFPVACSTILVVAGALVVSAWSPVTGTWSQSAPQGSRPSPRNQVTSQYDAVTDRLIISGGNSYGSLQNDVWVLSNATQPGTAPQWTQLVPGGPLPPAREGHASGYDPASNRLVIHGGWPGLSDTWVLTEANGLGGPSEWIQLPSAPLDRVASAYAYDPLSNRLMLFGGINVNYYITEGWYTDVWVLTNANGIGTPEWQQLTPVGASPPPRYYPATAYDPGSNRLIMHGGVTTDGALLGDMWVLTNANGLGGTPEWIELPVVGGPAPAVGQHFGYDPITKRGVIVGGETRGVDWYTREVWIVEDADGLGGSPTWTQAAMAGPDFGGNQVAGFGYTPVTNRVVLALGVQDSGYQSDVWLLQLRDTSYTIHDLHDPGKAFKGNTANLRIQIYDDSGANVSSSDIVVTALAVHRVSDETSANLEDSGNSNPDNNFYYDPDSRSYVFHLSTKGWAAGTYRLTLKAGTDPTVHTIEFKTGK